MEREMGPQVAPPIFLHQHQHQHQHKKRGYPWPGPAARQSLTMVSSDPGGNWNPKMWEWDSRRLAAKPSSPIAVSDALLLGNQPSSTPDADPRKRASEQGTKAVSLHKSGDGGHDDDEGLSLKLGGGPYLLPDADTATATATAMAEPVGRPNKRVRSGSPGNGGGGGNSGGGSYPMCQVDDCRADLSNAKDYHRRHKVCEIHSKTTKALVANQMQRFCQQCSRFHPLAEFDEGKRSCRRRLAGHNRRRRKTQPTDVASLLPGNQENASNRNLDIVNLITVLARLQGNNAAKLPSVPPIPDKDGLVQILSKLNSLHSANSPTKSPASGGVDLNASRGPQRDSVEKAVHEIGKQTAPSTMNLLAVLSAALAASAPETNASHSLGSSDSSGNNKSKSHSMEPAVVVNSHKKSIGGFPSTVVKGSNSTTETQPEISRQPVREAQPCLSLQLFGTVEEDSPPKVDSTIKYLSSESSNPMDERSPSSSPPITHKFFPIRSADEDIRDARMVDYGEDAATIEASTSRGWRAPLELFKDSERPVENGSPQNITYPPCCASTSCSDQSPSTSNSDGQDRTGRIIFKLFGKEPSTIPVNLRDQILNWLRHSPSEMEGYIRPGCLVLSIYLSMPPIAWDELEEHLLQRVNSLVQSSEFDFWRNGRFLVRTNTQLVSHKDGMIRLSKSWRTWCTPELNSVSPIAVVGGQKTSLVLKGRNLTIPGTKIHCTSMGKYISKEVLCSAYPGTIYDDSSVESFDFPGEPLLVLGRCFIEVENGFKGNSFPLIIANSTICQELRTLEVELEDTQTPDATSDEQAQDHGQSKSRENALHFLNELGWLFQRTNACDTSSSDDISNSDLVDFSITRFKYLLIFTSEREWCSLTKTLLNILAKRSSRSHELSQESLEMLSEIHLLNRAVKRKCTNMVHLLVHFVVVGPGNSNVYPFPPNLPGPGGLTPLHLAASTQNAEEIIDALTDDPQQIGLSCWNSVLDDNGQSPQMCATSRNNYSYNELVTRKLVDRKNGRISIMVDKEEICMDESWIIGESEKSGAQTLQARSCAKCSMIEAGLLRRPCRSRGLLARPYIHSMLAIAAVCVCVCVFMRGLLRINSGRSFKWERLDYGAI